jgi:IS1 family transposase
MDEFSPFYYGINVLYAFQPWEQWSKGGCPSLIRIGWIKPLSQIVNWRTAHSRRLFGVTYACSVDCFQNIADRKTVAIKSVVYLLYSVWVKGNFAVWSGQVIREFHQSVWSLHADAAALFTDNDIYRLFRGLSIQQGSVSRLCGFYGLFRYYDKSKENRPHCYSVRPSKESIPTWRVPLGVICVGIGVLIMCFCGGSPIGELGALACGSIGVMLILNGYIDCESGYNRNGKQYQITPHDVHIVPRKHLTRNSYWGTVIDMANVLNTDKQIAVIGALAEGSSIRSIERITGVHRDTIMRLGVKVGEGCASIMDSKMRNLPCRRLEMDEIWGFVGKKDRNVRMDDDPAVGSVWTFCAIDAETKLVPAFKVGERSATTAKAFVQDVADRMAYRVQISTDGLTAYVAAMESAFGGEVDYAQIIKTYGREETADNRRYSAPEFVSSEKKIFVGNPDVRLISTSYIERLNATTRLHMRRLTRLTLAFSKKRENFEAAVALHFAYYNFVKRHNTIRCTPAMAAGVASSFWSVGDLVEAAA